MFLCQLNCSIKSSFNYDIPHFIISPRTSWNWDFMTVILCTASLGNMRISKIIINLPWGVIYLCLPVCMCMYVCRDRSVPLVGGSWRLRYWFSWRQIRLECARQTNKIFELNRTNKLKFRNHCANLSSIIQSCPRSSGQTWLGYVLQYLPKRNCK